MSYRPFVDMNNPQMKKIFGNTGGNDVTAVDNNSEETKEPEISYWMQLCRTARDCALEWGCLYSDAKKALCEADGNVEHAHQMILSGKYSRAQTLS